MRKFVSQFFKGRLSGLDFILWIAALFIFDGVFSAFIEIMTIENPYYIWLFLLLSVGIILDVSLSFIFFGMWHAFIISLLSFFAKYD